MLKYLFQFSVIFLIHVNCGLIKREISNNGTFTLSLSNSTKDNNTLPKTTTHKNASVKDIDMDLIELTTDSSTTNFFATEINDSTESKKKTTSIIDNLNLFSTTTDQSQIDENSTTKRVILFESDYTTELKNENMHDLFTTLPPTSTMALASTTKNQFDINEIRKLNENNKLLEKPKNISTVSNVNTSISLKLPDQSKEKLNLNSTELYSSPTATSKSLVHQIKLNKKYDIVTNEIRNSTILNSSGNTKPAKSYKENIANSRDLNLGDSGEGLIFSTSHKNTKDKDKVKQNIVNETEIQQSITESSLKNAFTTSTPTSTPIDALVTLKKSNDDDLLHQNNNLKSSLTNHTNDTNSLNNSNTSSTNYSELITTNKIILSTTEMTMPTTHTNTNENFSSTTSENYQSTTKVYVTKNNSTEEDFFGTESLFTNLISTTEVTDTTTENLNDSTVVDQLNSLNDVQILDTLNNSTSVPVANVLSTTPFVNSRLTTYLNQNLKTTTPNNILFSTPVIETESSIETNSIEKTEKSTIDVYDYTTPNLFNFTIAEVRSPKLADIKEDTTNPITISLLTTIASKTSEKPPTESSIDNVLNNNDSLIMTPTPENNLNKTHSLEMEEIERSDNEPDYNVIIAISVSVIGIVALILLIGFLYVMRKRQKQLTYVQRCRPVSLDAYSLDNVSIYNSVRRKAALRASKRSYGNAAFDDPALIHNNMSIIDLVKFVERKSAIYEEFKNIPQIITRTDEVPRGCEEKNRYANVIPLPETRVVLKQINNDEKTEYINANFVRGPKDSPNYYIACQAPLEGTVVDFWRMIWEQNSRVIIMATDLIENGIEKCAEYLPASITLDNHVNFGDFQITLKNREVKEKYAVSILYLKNMNTNRSHEITHFWYKWPETGVPSDQAGIIAMLLEARSCLKVSNIDQTVEETTVAVKEKIVDGNSNGTSENNKDLSKTQGPLVIHCSPGTGRTGTITTIDIALRTLETTKRIDIPQIVYYVRRGRASSVQTTEQYEFIYRVVNVYAAKITGTANDN